MLLNDNAAWYYEQHVLGYNYRMTDLQAALGAASNKLESFFKKEENMPDV